jgi:4-hydroxybenzoate polyprenyltransferase
MEERRNSEAEDGSGSLRQLLGLKGAAADDGTSFLNWKIRLQLMKPATWVPLIWGVACGAAASGKHPTEKLRFRPAAIARNSTALRQSANTAPTCSLLPAGNYHAVWNLFGSAPTTDSWAVVGEDTLKAMGAMTLSGPILCGFTQTINDWFDRELDAINEPYRPIPSGKISPTEVLSPQPSLKLPSSIWFDRELDAITEPHRPIPSGKISPTEVRLQYRRGCTCSPAAPSSIPSGICLTPIIHTFLVPLSPSLSGVYLDWGAAGLPAAAGHQTQSIPRSSPIFPTPYPPLVSISPQLIPYPPLPPFQVYVQIGALLGGGLLLATKLDAWAQNEWPVVTLIATFGSFMAYIYSAPPLKLKAKIGG